MYESWVFLTVLTGVRFLSHFTAALELNTQHSYHVCLHTAQGQEGNMGE